MNKKILRCCFILIASFCLGCGLEDIVKKSDFMRETLQQHCNCEEVRIVNYTVSNGIHTTVACEMVGCPYEDKDEALKDIDSLLRSKVNDYCDIDEFTIDFISKGRHQVVRLDPCKEGK